MPWDLTLTEAAEQGMERTLEPLLYEWALVTTPFPIPEFPPPITPENPDPTDPTEECVEVYPSYGQIFPNPYALEMTNQPPPEEEP